jgi:hypothetical protein
MFQVAPSLKPFDEIDIFVGTAFTKTIGNPQITDRSLLAMFIRLYLGAALFAFKSAPHALKYFLNSQDLPLSCNFGFFFFGVFELFVKLNDIRHALKLLLHPVFDLRPFQNVERFTNLQGTSIASASNLLTVDLNLWAGDVNLD